MLPKGWVCPYLTKIWVETTQHFKTTNLGQIWTNPNVGLKM